MMKAIDKTVAYGPNTMQYGRTSRHHNLLQSAVDRGNLGNFMVELFSGIGRVLVVWRARGEVGGLWFANVNEQELCREYIPPCALVVKE